jgi:hypothetical protein
MQDVPDGEPTPDGEFAYRLLPEEYDEYGPWQRDNIKNLSEARITFLEHLRSEIESQQLSVAGEDKTLPGARYADLSFDDIFNFLVLADGRVYLRRGPVVG